jgi:dethiobiotin synthetase
VTATWGGTRPRHLVVVAGTGTEVGKTWVACQLAERLRGSGLSVAARKLAQSFADQELGATDAERLGTATGEKATDVCPHHRWYPVAMAPPMAAEALGAPPLLLAELLAETCWPLGTDVGLLEEAGGLGSPQASDADGVDVVGVVGPDVVVLVAGAGLGTLSNVGLAAQALSGRLPVPAARSGGRLVVYLNYFDPQDDLHRANQRWLVEREGLAVSASLPELVRAVMPAGL